LESGYKHNSGQLANCGDSQFEWANDNERNNIYGAMMEKAVIDRYEGKSRCYWSVTAAGG
jgi:hypothetical protein